MTNYENYEKLLEEAGFSVGDVYNHFKCWFSNGELALALRDMCLDYDLLDEEEESLI